MPIFPLIVIAVMIGIIAYGIIWSIVNNAKPKTSVRAQVMAIDKRDSGKMARRGGKVLLNLSRVYFVRESHTM